MIWYMHNVPPRNGAGWGIRPQNITPVLLLRTFLGRMWKSYAGEKLGVPVQPIEGVHPSEFTLAVQYDCGGNQCPESTTAFPLFTLAPGAPTTTSGDPSPLVSGSMSTLAPYASRYEV